MYNDRLQSMLVMASEQTCQQWSMNIILHYIQYEIHKFNLNFFMFIKTYILIVLIVVWI